MAAHSLIANKPYKISLPGQPFALRHLARDAEGYIKIQFRSYATRRNVDKQMTEQATAPREHTKNNASPEALERRHCPV